MSHKTQTMLSADAVDKGVLQLVEKPVPRPDDEEVLIRVEACGLCRSDSLLVNGVIKGVTYPCTPGHEVVGIIAARGANVRTQWRLGMRVGVGWLGGYCGSCGSCRSGDFLFCHDGKITGLSHGGGYGEYMTSPQSALVKIPLTLKPVSAAPILCGGVTVFNALRQQRLYVGSTVAIQGIGGLGHMAIMFAAKMGYRVIAISSSMAKKELSLSLGAHHYICDSGEDGGRGMVKELRKLGGADAILSTAPSAKSIPQLVRGLSLNGKLIVLGVVESDVKVSTNYLMSKNASVIGFSTGTAVDSERALAFAALHNIIPLVEEYPLQSIQEGYKRMMSNQARFRAVLSFSQNANL